MNHQGTLGITSNHRTSHLGVEITYNPNPHTKKKKKKKRETKEKERKKANQRSRIQSRNGSLTQKYILLIKSSLIISKTNSSVRRNDQQAGQRTTKNENETGVGVKNLGFGAFDRRMEVSDKHFDQTSHRLEEVGTNFTQQRLGIHFELLFRQALQSEAKVRNEKKNKGKSKHTRPMDPRATSSSLPSEPST
jgi:hypothetical protein